MKVQHGTVADLVVTQFLRLSPNAVIKIRNAGGTESTVNLTELAAIDSVGAADLAKIDGITNGTSAAGKAVVLGSSGEINTVAFGAITGSDSSLGVTGLAAAQGGAIVVTGGTSATAGNAGGAVSLVGGTPGATGIGGAVALTGAAGGATSGAGGAVTITGGAGTAGNGNGGSIIAAPGANHGSGLPGNLVLRTGAVWFKQSAATSDNADTPYTLTAAEMLGGISSMTPTTGRAVTTLTGAQIDAAISTTGLAADDAFEFSVQNRAAFAATDDILTLTAGASGVTVTGSAVISPGSTARFRARRTGAETYIIHKIAG
jgi:hypothetical protein